MKLTSLGRLPQPAEPATTAHGTAHGLVREGLLPPSVSVVDAAAAVASSRGCHPRRFGFYQRLEEVKRTTVRKLQIRYMK